MAMEYQLTIGKTVGCFGYGGRIYKPGIYKVTEAVAKAAKESGHSGISVVELDANGQPVVMQAAPSVEKGDQNYTLIENEKREAEKKAAEPAPAPAPSEKKEPPFVAETEPVTPGTEGKSTQEPKIKKGAKAGKVKKTEESKEASE